MDNYNRKFLEDFNIEQKLDLIDDIENKEEISREDLLILKELSYDKDDEIRSRVAESIMDSNNDLAEEILFRLVNDRDCLVRANACDSLCNNKSFETLELLKNRVLKDRYSLVRGYAALSIADIIVRNGYDSGEYIEFFSFRIKKEKVIWVKICIYRSLCLIGDRDFLKLFLSELNNRQYRNRSLVVNLLPDIISDENSETIKKVLIERMKKEKTIAVSSAIENILNGI